MIAHVTADGMLSLPVEAREQLGLAAGQAREVQTEGGLLVAWKKSDSDPFEKWRGRDHLPVGQFQHEYLRLIRDGDLRWLPHRGPRSAGSRLIARPRRGHYRDYCAQLNLWDPFVVD